MQPALDRQQGLRPFADGLSRTIQGRVTAVRSISSEQKIQGAPASPVEPWLVEPGGWEGDRAEALQSVDIELNAIEEVSPDLSQMRPVRGGLRLTLTAGIQRLQCGDMVSVPVRLRLPEVYRNPGAFSYADWLLTQGVGVLGTAPVQSLTVLSRSKPGLTCSMAIMQHWAAARLEALPSALTLRSLPGPLRLTEDDASVLTAMLFGDRSRLDEAQCEGFERTGTFHLLVVSGFHVALLTGALFWLLRKARVPDPAALVLTITAASCYALLTGFGVPAQRALAMSSLYLLATVLDRERSGLNALGTACLILLAADPRALFETSFQMTALVIVAVAGLAIPLERRLLAGLRSTVVSLEILELDAFLEPSVAARRVALRMWGQILQRLSGKPWAYQLPSITLRTLIMAAEAIILSAAVEACMALPMAVYFHRLAPTALPANLLISPLALVLIGSAVVMFTLGLVGSWLASVPAAITAAVLHSTTAIVAMLARSRFGDVRTPAPPTLAVAGCCGLLVLALWALRRRERTMFRIGAIAALAVPLVALCPSEPLTRRGLLEVTAIDVGQGDSLFVTAPDGHTMLVDAGGPVGRVATRWDVGEEVVAPYLWSRRVRRLDVVVITHGHSDHIGGMPAILRDLHPRELWLSLEPGRSSAIRALLTTAEAMNVRVRWLAAGDHLVWGGVQTSVLAPERSYSNFGEARNDDSLVLRFDWQRASVLMEGDAELPSETSMLAHGRLGPVTLLKVGHHGSRTSTSPEFLAAVAPKEAVISVGRENTFGHPRWEVLDRLEASHVPVYRTDRAGISTFLLSADGRIEREGAYN